MTTKNKFCSFEISKEKDIFKARKVIRSVTESIGFGIADTTRVVTVVSELARNIYHYASCGIMQWQQKTANGKPAIEITFNDEGPGIENITHAMQEGISSACRLGLGLPGSKKLVNEFNIDSIPGKGTCVTILKWKSN